MSLDKDIVDKLHYMGYVSYGERQIPTKKPGIDDYYIKNCYSDISNYPQRKIPYFDDKLRYRSLYQSEYLKNLAEQNYLHGKDETLQKAINLYDHSESPTSCMIINDKTIKKKEPIIRES